MTQTIKQPPPRREPGLFSRVFTMLVRFFTGLIAALLLSLVIEWIGIAFFWPEQGERHAQEMLLTETHYVDRRFIHQTQALGQPVYTKMQQINQWISQNSGIVPLIQRLSLPTKGDASAFQVSIKQLYQKSQPYIIATVTITQLFFVRLTIIVLSLPVFLLFVVAGLVDGLIERCLRRQGGGRESSNVYNLARKSVLPTFMAACVIYISLPLSLHPAVVMLPFAVLMGFTVKLTFDKLKKYF